MANTAANVSVGKPKVSGAIYRAPKGTTVPTDATTALDAAFKCLGYISDSGLVNSNSAATGSIKAWGGERVYDYLTEKPDTFKFTLIECLNVDALKAVYGDNNVTGDLESGIKISATNEDLDTNAWVVEMILNGGVLKRIVIPEAKVTTVGDVTYADESAIGYETTISAYAVNGITHEEYIIKQS